MAWRHVYDPDAVMQPVRSGALSTLSTSSLAVRYAAAAAHVEHFRKRVDLLRRLETRAQRLDQKAARWRRRDLGVLSQRRARHLDRQAQRLDTRRLTLEMRIEAEHRDAVFDIGDRGSPTFQALVEAAETLAGGVLWDIVATGDPTHIKSSSSVRMARRRSRLDVGRLTTLRPDLDAMRLKNVNGPDLWLFPDLVALGDSGQAPALIALSEVRLEANALRFVESGALPDDAHVMERTWRFVNRDETPDQRFSDNPELDVALYGHLSFTSDRGLREDFLTSDAPAALAFGRAFHAHREALRA